MQSVSSRVPANLELWSCAGANGDRAVVRIAGHQRSNAQDILGLGGTPLLDTTCLCRNSRTHIINIYTIIVQTQFRQTCVPQILFHLKLELLKG